MDISISFQDKLKIVTDKIVMNSNNIMNIVKDLAWLTKRVLQRKDIPGIYCSSVSVHLQGAEPNQAVYSGVRSALYHYLNIMYTQGLLELNGIAFPDTLYEQTITACFYVQKASPHIDQQLVLAKFVVSALRLDTVLIPNVATDNVSILDASLTQTDAAAFAGWVYRHYNALPVGDVIVGKYPPLLLFNSDRLKLTQQALSLLDIDEDDSDSDFVLLPSHKEGDWQITNYV